MGFQLVPFLRSLPLGLLVLAGGCSGDEPAPKAEAAPDADVLRVLGVPAGPGDAAGEGVRHAGPGDAGKAPASAASPEKPSGPAASRHLKVEISEPRFDSEKRAPAPSVSQAPGSSLDY